MGNLIRSSYEWVVRSKRLTVSLLRIKAAERAGSASIYKAEKKHALSISPKKFKEIYIKDLRRGKYRLEIQHSDFILEDNRRSIVAYFESSSGERSHDLANRLGVNLGDGGAFAYMGGGRRRNGKIYQIQDLNITHALHWLKVTLYSPYDRFINVDSFKISKISPIETKGITKTPNALEMAVLANNWLDVLENPDAIKYAIYADINMNVVDGSSVWLSSMISILASDGKTLVVSKSTISSDIITSNILNKENVVFVSPGDLGLAQHTLTIKEAVNLLKALDAGLPQLSRMFIRGLEEAFTLFEDRQFYNRVALYLTNFYVVEDNRRVISDEVRHKARVSVLHAKYVLAQTRQISDAIRSLTKIGRKTFILPPPVPTKMLLENISLPSRVKETIRVGYAGKIVPQWGVDILLDWVLRLQADGVNIELYIAANRVSDGYGRKKVAGYSDNIREKMSDAGAIFYSDFNRSKSMSLMSKMDFIWCFRPAALEDNTLELSTKLVEMVSMDKPCIAYPNDINRQSLGEKYPYFVKTYDDFRSIVLDKSSISTKNVARKVKAKHSIDAIAKRVAEQICNYQDGASNVLGKKILFAGHDLKFIDAFVSDLKSQGSFVSVDRWEWGESRDLNRSKNLRDWADVVFCEWGLANAVWYSNNKKLGSLLIVRIHLQEINPSARKFGPAINVEAVDLFIFVSARVRDEAIRMFGWPIEKTAVIPNYVLDEEYKFQPPKRKKKVTLGMIGIVPSRKRFDRAVKLLKSLLAEGYDATLKIKGPRPEDLPFMHAPSRAGELGYYYAVYEEMEEVADRIIFEGWGNDVALWYQGVDFILSPSDFESFHYALADGVLSGCWPLIWPWEEAKEIYDSEWIVSDTNSALSEVTRVLDLSMTSRRNELIDKRNLILSRYGQEKIFLKLRNAITIDQSSLHNPSVKVEL